MDLCVDKNKLILMLASQKVVNNDIIAATELAEKVDCATYNVGDVIISQDELSDYMYFILSGKVDIQINGRHKDYRGKGETIGEMSLVNMGGKRSASAIICEPSTLARIKQEDFAEIADQRSGLWKNIAKCLAERLHARNVRERVKNPKPIVFMASSSEGKDIMDAIEEKIKCDSIELRPWTSDELFGPSTHPIETLEKMAREVDFAIIIQSPDDRLRFRKKSMLAPRDNVIFEQGLFVGGLGRERTFVVSCSKKPQRGIKKIFQHRPHKSPSDYDGLTVLKHCIGEDPTETCNKIKFSIDRLKTI